MIKVSVIIPAYNVEMYIEECICSVLSQTLEELELIVVDDGSKDGTAEIIKRYEAIDQRVQYVYQENKGIGASRNTGWRKATGDYIYFLDSDDFIHPDTLKVFYDIAVHQNLDIVCGDYYVFYLQGLKLEELDRIKFEASDFQVTVFNPVEFVYNSRKYSSMVWRYFFNKNKLDQIGYRFYEYVFEDCEFLHKTIFLFNRIGYIPFDFYYYRQREGSFCYEQIGRQRLIGSVKIIESLDAFERGALVDRSYRPYFSMLLSAELMRTISYRNQYVKSIDRHIDQIIKKNLRHFKQSHKFKHRLIYGFSCFNLFLASSVLKMRMLKQENRKTALLREPLKVFK
jgi:glycosyltransferase involved in cell wall biosynthesis